MSTPESKTTATAKPQYPRAMIDTLYFDQEFDKDKGLTEHAVIMPLARSAWIEYAERDNPDKALTMLSLGMFLMYEVLMRERRQMLHEETREPLSFDEVAPLFRPLLRLRILCNLKKLKQPQLQPQHERRILTASLADAALRLDMESREPDLKLAYEVFERIGGFETAMQLAEKLRTIVPENKEYIKLVQDATKRFKAFSLQLTQSGAKKRGLASRKEWIARTIHEMATPADLFMQMFVNSNAHEAGRHLLKIEGGIDSYRRDGWGEDVQAVESGPPALVLERNDRVLLCNVHGGRSASRSMETRRAIKSGEVVLSEPPIVAFAGGTSWVPMCSYCLKRIPITSIFLCPRCNSESYCSQGCWEVSMREYHAPICDTMSTKYQEKLAEVFERKDMAPTLGMRLIVRLSGLLRCDADFPRSLHAKHGTSYAGWDLLPDEYPGEFQASVMDWLSAQTDFNLWAGVPTEPIFDAPWFIRLVCKAFWGTYMWSPDAEDKKTRCIGVFPAWAYVSRQQQDAQRNVRIEMVHPDDSSSQPPSMHLIATRDLIEGERIYV